jgi:hypothetical protein
MSLDDIKQEVATWPEEQIRKLRAYLYVLHCERAGEPVIKSLSKLDDPNRRWFTIEEAEKIWSCDQEDG